MVPTNNRYGRPSASRASTAANCRASAPDSGSSGRKRRVSTPWWATKTSALTSHHRCSSSAVTRLGHTTAAARRAATAIARRNSSTLARWCQLGASKKLRSCTVTTAGTDERSGMV